MTKYINLGKVTAGKFAGELTITAKYWETRYSWGHTATIMDESFNTVGYCKIRYLNRTWEYYPFQSAIHGALHDFVTRKTGIDPFSVICKRDSKPMINPSAESRRRERVEAHKFAEDLYHALTDIVDGNKTEEKAAALLSFYAA